MLQVYLNDISFLYLLLHYIYAMCDVWSNELINGRVLHRHTVFEAVVKLKVHTHLLNEVVIVLTWICFWFYCDENS